LSLIFFGGD